MDAASTMRLVHPLVNLFAGRVIVAARRSLNSAVVEGAGDDDTLEPTGRPPAPAWPLESLSVDPNAPAGEQSGPLTQQQQQIKGSTRRPRAPPAAAVLSTRQWLAGALGGFFGTSAFFDVAYHLGAFSGDRLSQSGDDLLPGGGSFFSLGAADAAPSAGALLLRYSVQGFTVMQLSRAVVASADCSAGSHTGLFLALDVALVLHWITFFLFDGYFPETAAILAPKWCAALTGAIAVGSATLLLYSHRRNWRYDSSGARARRLRAPSDDSFKPDPNVPEEQLLSDTSSVSDITATTSSTTGSTAVDEDQKNAAQTSESSVATVTPRSAGSARSPVDAAPESETEQLSSLEENKEIARLQKLLRSKERRLARAILNFDRVRQQNSEMMGSFSTELTTTLNGALGILGFMVDAPEMTERGREYSRSIEKSLEFLLPTIAGTAQLAKLKSGAPLAMETFDLRKTVEAAMTRAFDYTYRILKETKRENRLQYDFAHQFESGFPTLIYSDESSLRTVIEEFTKNALRFSRGGQVWIEVLVSPLAASKKQWKKNIFFQQSLKGIGGGQSLIQAESSSSEAEHFSRDPPSSGSEFSHLNVDGDSSSGAESSADGVSGEFSSDLSRSAREASSDPESVFSAALSQLKRDRTHFSPRGKNPEWIMIRVHDDGPGIPEENISNIFKPFMSSQKGFGGSGIGLANAQAITEAMGGKIIVESELEKGSIFSVVVPVEIPISIGEETATRSSNAHCLVVEARPRTGEMMRSTLQRLGCTVSIWSNWVDGVRELRRSALMGRPYQILFLGGESIQGAFEVEDIVLLLAEEVANVKLVLVSTKDSAEALDDSVSASFWKTISIPIEEKQIERVLARFSLESTVDLVDTSDVMTSGTSEDESGAPPLQPRKLRILVAEDNAMFLRILKDIIEKAGHKCDTATNGKAAVQAANKHAHDLILMDLQMPIMDGLSATKMIRKSESRDRPRTPIVALTATASDSIREDCMKAGFDDFLGKPVKRATLLELLTHLGHGPKSHRRRRSNTPRDSMAKAAASVRNHGGTKLRSITEEEDAEDARLGQAKLSTKSSLLGVGVDAQFARSLVIGNSAERHILMSVVARFGFAPHGIGYGQEHTVKPANAPSIQYLLVDVTNHRPEYLEALVTVWNLPEHHDVFIVVMLAMQNDPKPWRDAGASLVVTTPLDYLALLRHLIDVEDRNRESSSDE